MMDAFSTLGLKLKRENVSEDMDGVRFLLRDMAPRYAYRIFQLLSFSLLDNY